MPPEKMALRAGWQEIARDIFFEDKMEALARAILQTGKRKILLQGAMGAGKTTLAKSLIAQLSGTPFLGSPTYPIVLQYPELIHLDFYRVASFSVLWETGILEMVFAPGQTVIIEWPDLIWESPDSRAPEFLRAVLKVEMLPGPDPETRAITLLQVPSPHSPTPGANRKK